MAAFCYIIDMESRKVIQKIGRQDDQLSERVVRECFSEIEKLIDQGEEKLMSWQGCILREKDAAVCGYLDAGFVLTSKRFYTALHVPEKINIYIYEMSNCIGTQVFRGDGFEISEFALDFSSESVYFLYDKNDIEVFEAEFCRFLGKYGHQDDLK